MLGRVVLLGAQLAAHLQRQGQHGQGPGAWGLFG